MYLKLYFVRPLEATLACVNLITLCVLIRYRCARVFAAIGILVALLQLQLEGPRWQLLPAYVLAGAFASIAAFRRPWRGMSGNGIGACAVALAFAVALPLAMPIFRFPQPTGPYAIGSLTYHWTDPGRTEIFSSDPNRSRELIVQVWYPARSTPGQPRALWLADADALAPALGRLFHVPEFTFGYLRYITANSVEAAPSLELDSPAPVLVFLEGLSGFRQHNTFQVEELVSHGYVVAGIDQPYSAASVVFPDGHLVDGLSREEMQPLIDRSLSQDAPVPMLAGRPVQDGIVPFLAQDVTFTLDQLAAINQADPYGVLTGRMDLQRVGIFGISLGGILTGEACHSDGRLRACLVMDAPMTADVVHSGLTQPSMWITRDASTMRQEGWSDADIQEHQNTMRAVYDSLPGDGYFVRVAGLFHLNLTDLPALSPFTSVIGLTGPIDPQRAHRIVNAYSLAFFDRSLLDRSPALLGSPGEFPEVVFESHSSPSN